ncbi:MAG: V-type ATP synthase subunit F [bacterium]|nr:V-type ATP synthase subunit F [bacterium]
MEYSIAIIGSPTAILGFKALGVTAFPVASAEEGRAAVEKIRSGKYGILLITEDWAEELSQEINELKSGTLPAVTVLPSQSGSTGAGEKELRSIVERAVGSDILFSNE